MKRILVVIIAVAGGWFVATADAQAPGSYPGGSSAHYKWVTPAQTESRMESGQRVRVLTGEMTIVAPGMAQAGESSVVAIDARDFTKGTIEIELTLGAGASDGSFALYDRAAAGGDPESGWARVRTAYDRRKGTAHKLSHSFTKGGVFRFAGQGNWFSKKGSTNKVAYRILIKGAPSGTPAALRFVRQTQQGFEAIQTVRHGEPFFVEARFDAEPSQGERNVSLEWGDGQRQEVVVLKTDDPKVFRSRVMTVEPNATTSVVNP